MKATGARRLLALLMIACLTCCATTTCLAATADAANTGVHDLSLLVAPQLPCVWPVGMTQHLVVPSRTFGPGPYHRDLVMIDEHTGTQWDAPAHFIPPPDSGLPEAGPMGAITSHKVPAWQFVGQACVIDITTHVDDAGDGASFLITPEIIWQWEQENGSLGAGDVVLFRSGYTDRYYKRFPAGNRFVQAPLRGQAPAWPAPTPQAMSYLAERGVLAAGIDSPSMGPLPNLAAATHQAGARYGMIWTECATNLGVLPAKGAAYLLLAAKHEGGSGGEARAIGVTDRRLAARIIKSASAKRVIDLSMLLDEDLPVSWPGYGPGDEASRYIAKTLNAFSKARGPYFARTHMLDSQTGTHLVTPSFSLPPASFDSTHYSADVSDAWTEFQSHRSGGAAISEITTEQVPLDALIGPAHIIDVSRLVGTTSQADWPASPVISMALIKQHEQTVRPVKAGDVVIFHSGYCDKHFQPYPAAPEKDRLLAAPLAGEAEGWPAPDPSVIDYWRNKASAVSARMGRR